jgi:uncharacterized protein (TIGR00297 family)
MAMDLIIFFFLVFAAVFLSIRANVLTYSAAITGGVLAIFIFLGSGLTGVLMLGIFVVVGSLVTKWKIREKQNMNLAEQEGGRRTVGQVLANGAAAAIFSFLAFIFPAQSVLFIIMMASAISSATADTISSELGTLYGRNFYNIITLNKDEKGLDGVISMEGTLFGVAGSCVIASVYSITYGWNIIFIIIVLAGTIGNFMDSILGATLERRGALNNEMVNFLNTIFGAISALLMYYAFM